MTSRDLTQAQRAKMARLCDQLALTPGDHLLEIGTGWGALAEYAARHYGCRVTTTTLSREQHRWATERMARAGLQDRVEVLLCDYRDLRGEYDKLVSVEMIEAVGQRYLPAFFRTCQARLRPGGRMALQAITIQDQRYRDYSKSVDFIQRYIFPGGFFAQHHRNERADDPPYRFCGAQPVRHGPGLRPHPGALAAAFYPRPAGY
ncbi:cyclopropane-fatty-acyl-phospholipid synthase family protein [Klebsiella variicola subsp. variicola]|nr:cyclopropane-fatty-acyl-phospholipid synthase family protein [Klebsiella variicola subsp. variicola]